jgi:hypothetical protein
MKNLPIIAFLMKQKPGLEQSFLLRLLHLQFDAENTNFKAITKKNGQVMSGSRFPRISSIM